MHRDDIKPLADAIFRDRVLRARAEPPGQKLLAGEELFHSVCRWSSHGIRHQHPDWLEAQVLQELRRRCDLLRRIPAHPTDAGSIRHGSRPSVRGGDVTGRRRNWEFERRSASDRAAASMISCSGTRYETLLEHAPCTPKRVQASCFAQMYWGRNASRAEFARHLAVQKHEN